MAVNAKPLTNIELKTKAMTTSSHCNIPAGCASHCPLSQEKTLYTLFRKSQ